MAARMSLEPRQPLRVKQITPWWEMPLERVSKMEHGAEYNQDALLPSAAQFQSLLMEQFKATVMNWAPLYESPVTEASNWCQLAHHSELVSPMAKEKGNGQRWILLAT